jgi:hypothetical protein
MAIKTINLGNYANDGTGDDLRTAFVKVNENFASIAGEVNIASAANIGGGIGVFAQRTEATLDFKSFTSNDSSITIVSDETTIDFKSVTVLENDTAPRLGADLGLNGRTVFGPGDVQTTIHGIDIQLMNALLSLMISSNSQNIDLGSFLFPTGFETNLRGYTFDMGYFIDPPLNNQLDFGNFNS